MDWGRLQQAQKPILLYGMGDGADRILDTLSQKGITPSGVFASDEFVRGQCFRGFEVLSYAKAKETFGNMIVLLAFGTSRPEVLERIETIAKEQELYAPDFPVVQGPLFTASFAKEHEKELRFVYERLADQQSKDVFESTVRYKLSGDIKVLRRCESEAVEAYETILKLGSKEVFVDLGAYRGDTVAEFVRYCPDYEKIYAFEPDSYSYRHLQKNTQHLADCLCINCAASSEPGTVLFCSRGGRNSSAGKSGKPIAAESVDHVLGAQRATFLNIDVEGQEYAAIAGAEITIRRDKPKMLVAAYHRSEDLFQIPLQVLSMRPDYQLYMRHFTQLPAWDTNFYFV